MQTKANSALIQVERYFNRSYRGFGRAKTRGAAFDLLAAEARKYPDSGCLLRIMKLDPGDGPKEILAKYRVDQGRLVRLESGQLQGRPPLASKS